MVRVGAKETCRGRRRVEEGDGGFVGDGGGGGTRTRRKARIILATNGV